MFTILVFTVRLVYPLLYTFLEQFPILPSLFDIKIAPVFRIRKFSKYAFPYTDYVIYFKLDCKREIRLFTAVYKFCV